MTSRRDGISLGKSFVYYFFLCFPLHKGKVLAISTFADSQKSFQWYLKFRIRHYKLFSNWAGKHFYDLKPQVTTKLKYIISLEIFQRDKKITGLSAQELISPVKA